VEIDEQRRAFFITIFITLLLQLLVLRIFATVWSSYNYNLQIGN